MKLLITGASGFIGKNFLSYIEDNHLLDLMDIILLSSKCDGSHICVPHNNYNFTKEDFLSQGITEINVVLHLGAFTPKCGSQADNIQLSFSNIKNTLHLLQNLPAKPNKIVFISTLDVYSDSSIIDEETMPNPSSLYGWSKLFCEKLISQYAKENGIDYQILRIGHIYGPGEENYQKLIPLTICRILNNEDPVIFTDGSELRSFLYIFDCCKAIWKAITLTEMPGPINIVSKHGESVKNIVKLLIDISGKKLSIQILNQPIQTRDLLFNADKMEHYLCHEAENLKSGLEKEFNYMKLLYSQKD